MQSSTRFWKNFKGRGERKFIAILGIWGIIICSYYIISDNNLMINGD